MTPRKSLDEGSPPRREARNRNGALQVYVTDAERARIEANAKRVGMTLSTFLRNVAMGPVSSKSVFDMKAIETLAQVNADLARLGNLLRLYLHEPNADRATANRLIASIAETKGQLSEAARNVRT